MFIFQDEGGAYLLKDADDLMKGIGIIEQSVRPIIMTNESGHLVGAGFDGKSLIKSMGAVKALNKPERMLKKSYADEVKSVSSRCLMSRWESLQARIAAMA